MKNTLLKSNTRASLVKAVIISHCFLLFESQGEVLSDSGSSWEYLCYRSGDNAGTDPATVDGDFETTWNNDWVANYDGPTFSVGSGRMGYWEDFSIENDDPNFNTLIWDGTGEIPDVGTRQTSFFRTVFTPTVNETYLQLTGYFDDGAIFYINGQEVARANVNSGNSWGTRASYSASTSLPMSEIIIPYDVISGVALELAVSVHSYNPNDDRDLIFELQVDSLSQPQISNDHFANARDITSKSIQIGAYGQNDDGQGTLLATREVGEPEHGELVAGGSMWWKWTAPETRIVELRVTTETFDPVFAIYRGDSLPELELSTSFRA